MRVAVAGGTGLVGRHLVNELREAGHQPVVLSRSAGVDLLAGENVIDALQGVEAVVDVTNTPAIDPDTARAFFGGVTRNLLEAERATGVQHHLVLSIVGLDRVKGNGHYAGKRLQEQTVRESGVPATIVRATQFFQFAEMLVRWTRSGDGAQLPPLLVQPLAPRDLARVLATLATAGEAGGMIEVAGPEPQDLVDMARRALAARGESLRLQPTWRGLFGPEMAGEALLPGDEAVITAMTFEDWLGASGAADDEIDAGKGSQP
ncbi:MAG TPA: NAD(P)H-binding protein [Solirubrobacteraceae bacterium]|nr:NAD(P)H-binding protein [Solirubrobacteraceae bacterium]